MTPRCTPSTGPRPKAASRPVQAGPQHILRNTGDRFDFSEIVAFGAQDQQRALVVLELQVGALERTLGVCLLQGFLRPGPVVHQRRCRISLIDRNERRALLVPGAIDESVVQYPQQPALRMIGGADIGRVLADRDAHVLHQVLRIVAIAGQPVGDAQQHGQVRRHHRVEPDCPGVSHALPFYAFWKDDVRRLEM